MATGDYCTVGELKNRIWPAGSTPDTDEDIMLQSVITAISRVIDNYCGRRFYTTSTDETRYFTTSDEEYLYPHYDIVSVTSIAVDYNGDRTYNTSMDTGDYDLLPADAATDSKPYSYIRVSPLGTERFPSHQNGVKIVGKFGWSTVPVPVKEACILQAQRLWKRKDAPFGIISNPAGGEMRLIDKLDPDIELLLYPYRKWV